MRSGIYGLRLLGEPRVQRTVVGLLLVVALIVRAGQFVVFSTRIQWGYDFSAYWRAARNLLDGASIYTAGQLAGPYAPQEQFLYLYPPPLAVGVTPFAAIFGDYRVAAIGWAAVGLVVLVGAVSMVARAEGLAVGRDRWWWVAAALAFPPVVGELVLGNVHILLLGLLSAAWLGIRSGSERGQRLAGIAVGVAAMIKVFPGLLVVWFLVTGRRSPAAWAIAGAAVVAAVALPVTGLAPWLDYPTVLANLSAPSDTTDTLAPTVWLAGLVGFGPARLVVTGMALVAVVVAGRGRSAAIGFAATVVASVLVAPALYHHYLAILVLPLLLAARHADRRGWVVVAYLLMWGGTQPALGDLAWIVNRALPASGAVLLLIGLVCSSRQARTEPDGVPRPISAAGASL